MLYFICAAGVAAVAAFVLVRCLRAPSLPDELDVIPVGQILEFCALERGTVSVELIDPSGRPVDDLGQFDQPCKAVRALQAAFRKANVRAVRICESRPRLFVVHSLAEVDARAAHRLGGAVLRCCD
jgi:hypothetical protein